MPAREGGTGPGSVCQHCPLLGPIPGRWAFLEEMVLQVQGRLSLMGRGAGPATLQATRSAHSLTHGHWFHGPAMLPTPPLPVYPTEKAEAAGNSLNVLRSLLRSLRCCKGSAPLPSSLLLSPRGGAASCQASSASSRVFLPVAPLPPASVTGSSPLVVVSDYKRAQAFFFKAKNVYF